MWGETPDLGPIGEENKYLITPQGKINPNICLLLKIA